MSASLPANEEQRISKLIGYGILDTHEDGWHGQGQGASHQLPTHPRKARRTARLHPNSWERNRVCNSSPHLPASGETPGVFKDTGCLGRAESKGCSSG